MSGNRIDRGTLSDQGFYPISVLRNPHLQSILASSKLRRWVVSPWARPMLAAAQEHLLDCGRGVRLQGYYSPQARADTGRGLVVLLHGWEGCTQSTYMISSGALLYRKGFEVFRLNLRDHGDTHHLNQGIFHSCRIDEAVGALEAVARQFPTRPLFLAGFSLGGNFALRIALRAPQRGVPLRRVVAISPVIKPANVVCALDEGPFFYRRHFIRKWRDSLRRKQACFPDHYDFSEWFKLGSITDKTRYLVEYFGPFSTLEDYLEGYSVAGKTLVGLRVPSHIISAVDDPIIPVGDLHSIESSECLSIQIVPYGGHCGFIADLSLCAWAEHQMVGSFCAEPYPNAYVGPPSQMRSGAQVNAEPTESLDGCSEWWITDRPGGKRIWQDTR